VVTVDHYYKANETSDPAFIPKYTGLVHGDTVANFSGALSRDAGETNRDYSINQGSLAATGNYMINSFTSGILTIKDAPSIVSHTPVKNSDGIALASDAVITFSEPVTADASDFTITPPTTFTVSGTGTNVITLHPTNGWKDNSHYTITVTTGVKDLHGLQTTNAESWSFSTVIAY